MGRENSDRKVEGKGSEEEGRDGGLKRVLGKGGKNYPEGASE